jgi:hypothetical protein
VAEDAALGEWAGVPASAATGRDAFAIQSRVRVISSGNGLAGAAGVERIVEQGPAQDLGIRGLTVGPVRARVIVVNDSAVERRDLAARSGHFICAYAQACSYQVTSGHSAVRAVRWNGDRPRLDEG